MADQPSSKETPPPVTVQVGSRSVVIDGSEVSGGSVFDDYPEIIQPSSECLILRPGQWANLWQLIIISFATIYFLIHSYLDFRDGRTTRGTVSSIIATIGAIGLIGVMASQARRPGG